MELSKAVDKALVDSEEMRKDFQRLKGRMATAMRARANLGVKVGTLESIRLERAAARARMRVWESAWWQVVYAQNRFMSKWDGPIWEVLEDMLGYSRREP